MADTATGKPLHIHHSLSSTSSPCRANGLLSRLLVAQHVDRGVPHAASSSAQVKCLLGDLPGSQGLRRRCAGHNADYTTLHSIRSPMARSGGPRFC